MTKNCAAMSGLYYSRLSRISIVALRTLLLVGFCFSAHAKSDSPLIPIFGKSTPNGSFSMERLQMMQDEKQAQIRESDGFLIDSGALYYFVPSVSADRIAGISDVRQIILYKNKLIAVDGAGVVAILTEDRKPGSGKWIKIGDHATDIETDGRGIFALTVKRDIFNLQGSRDVAVFRSPGSEISFASDWDKMISRCADVTSCFTSDASRLINGFQIRLTPAGISDVFLFQKFEDQVFALKSDGRRVLLSR